MTNISLLFEVTSSARKNAREQRRPEAGTPDFRQKSTGIAPVRVASCCNLRKTIVFTLDSSQNNVYDI